MIKEKNKWDDTTFFIVLFLMVLIGSCEKPEATIAQKQFTLLESSATGITFSNTLKDTRETNILLYANFYGGAGVGVGDFNNDGLQDIYFAGNKVPDQLYINKGNLVFEDQTSQAGVKDDGGWSTGVTIADVNNDGFSDIYVSRELYDHKPEWRRNLLYINKGDGTFEESAEQFGIANDQRTRHATFLDYDKDGLLDLFLLTQPPNPGNFSEFKGSVLIKPEYTVRLYRNQGTFFEDVTEAAGVMRTGFPNGVSASDVNNDGWTDIYVANDFYAPDYLFINNKDGTFTNTVDTALNHMSYYSMGVDVADINNDALLDIFVVDMVAEDNFRSKSNMSGMDINAFWKVVANGGHYQYMYNALQLNNGNGTFSDVSQLTGMSATDWSWANLIADFDNDGLKDVYITNGLLNDIRNTDADQNVGQFVQETANTWIRENPNGGEISIWEILDLEKTIALLPSEPLQNYAYKNHGNLKFEKTMDAWGLDEKSFSNGAAYADLDNDGDLDIVVNNINEEAFVYRNNAEKKKDANYLRVSLEQKENRPIFGARVALYTQGEVQLQEITNVRGIYSTSESLAHFGLGKQTKIDSLIVTWPNQKVSKTFNIASNQAIHINAQDASYSSIEKTQKELLFKQDSLALNVNFRHRENNFDDYTHQLLLPHKMSQFGPALATGDINNDGLDDVFVGGATGFQAFLYVQQDDGSFRETNSDFWKKEDAYEDVDAIFADINGDGYQDLYVVSGGNVYPKNDPHYIDRLYINDGKGNFSKGAILQVNRASGSKVVPGDYDQDGDIDLFVGGRHVPHQYPLPASSMILQNEKGQLINKTNEIASELKDIGMVTDAVWTDYDADGDTDLMIVGEWMPITILKKEGNLFQKTAISALENTSGWWFSLAQGDFDQDGDMDFIAGNLGLNYKYKTSEDNPFDIYYDDFDKNGVYDIVLGYYNNNKHYPLRGFSCSSEQIPMLKKNIGKYDAFASLEIEEVYGEGNLENALRYEAKTFESSYIENRGNGNFKISALPQTVQRSNSNDILINDFNEDGYLDVLTIGNLFVSEIETPRNDAGIGALLVGDGKGKFVAVDVSESGFFAPKDAKKVRLLQTKGQAKILVANNNDQLQSFTLNRKKPIIR